MTVEAITIREYGSPDQLTLEPVVLTAPKAGEVQIRQTAIGVNYHDVYVRSGLYKTLDLPGIPGCEATGVVEAIGADVSGLAVGDRIAYVTSGYGAYASHRNLSAQLAVLLPDSVTDEIAASNLLRAMTVEILTTRVFRVAPDNTVLVHAAAGGVGRLLCQAASSIGATVIGTVGSTEKAAIAKDNGCEHSVLYREVDFVQAAMNITKGRGVNVVYDSVGADTFAGSIDALALCGHLVNFGQSSGPVDPLPMTTLATKSSSVSRPILFHYLRDADYYQSIAATVIDKFRSGELKAGVHTPIPLSDARLAHNTLENMSGGGSLILVPRS